MKSDIAKAWVAELRSGKWTQTTGSLRRGPPLSALMPPDYNDPDDAAYCCLGVLCELAVRAGRCPMPVWSELDHAWMYGIHPDEKSAAPRDRAGTLPAVVQEWAGMRTENGDYDRLPDGSSQCALTVDNDNGKSFEEIAATIERYAEEL